MTLATIDLETDPFEHGKVPKPFVAGFYDGEEYAHWWGPDCVKRAVDWLRKTTKGPYLIYAHNGGRFDYFYFLSEFHGELRIINTRIIQAHIGRHEFRDSYSIMPFPLRDFKKDEIDYEKMRANVREKHRAEIVSYLRTDCVELHTLVVAFHAEFGNNLTIGGSALKQLRARHKFKCGGQIFDEKFRKDFYFGGRVQVFQAGIFHKPVKIYDVNSMYPHVMATTLHPVGTSVIIDKTIKKNTCFVVAEGENFGAFPVRGDDGSLSFTKESGRFSTTIHEWNAAEDTGRFRCKRIVKTIGFDDRISFTEFVHHFYGARKLAKFHGDKIHTLFYKFVLNSSYGKFAQNPENFEDNQIRSRTDEPLELPWKPAYVADDYIIWQKPSETKHYYNICTGASITGAARAVLLRGLSNAEDLYYCDTDSIICGDLRNVAFGDSELGDWKLEATGDTCAIAGKKLYAVVNIQSLFPCTCKTPEKGKCTVHIKKAHKGAFLTYEQILAIAGGAEVKSYNPVPSFRLDGTHQFISRRMRRTT